MSKLDFGEIVLLQFPFTDGANYKKRPALVLYDSQDGDLIVARITSRSKDTGYDIEITEWQDAGLKLPSIVRLHKVATLELTLIERKLGKLKDTDLGKIREVIQQIIKDIGI